MKAAILGTGSWGCSFGRHLASAWDEVVLWGIESEQVANINIRRENPGFLDGIELPRNLRATRDMQEAAGDADALFFVIPSQAIREVARRTAALDLRDRVPAICLAKGLELSTLKRLSEVLAEELSPAKSGRSHPVSVLLGPSHAEEVARNLPTAVTLAGQPDVDWEVWQHRLAGPRFRVYTNDDLVGVEISSAFKNVISLAVGLSDGLGLGDNARGTLVTRGMAELMRVGRVMGGRSETFYGLAGIGDLITTCTSRHSRNRNFGEEVGRSKLEPQQILAASRQVVEGVVMTQAALKLGEKHQIELPITKEVHNVLFSGKPAWQAMQDLMDRQPRSEVES
jgi:glycerol-3-phosphate dehydrogenase (NAD(P)+)